MGSFHDSIPPHLIKWIMEQHLFFVATAPLSPDAPVNVSPKELKGLFEVVDENKVWYQDLTGSGESTSDGHDTSRADF
jgi:hypothetical protein